MSTMPYRPAGAVPPFAVSEILPPLIPPAPAFAVRSIDPKAPFPATTFTDPAVVTSVPLLAVMAIVELYILDI